MPIEIVFDMLGFNMLNPKMKNHPPFVLPRLSNMQRSQHTKLLRRNKDSFWNFLACLSYSNEFNLKVLAQYYSVLQSTTPVLLCTTKHYSGTTLYYKVLLQYYSVLQSTSPEYYSNTTLYYKVLLCTTKYLHTWNVIYNARSNKSQPPTSASTAPARKNDSRDQPSSHMKRYLQSAEEQVSLSKLTKYCACHEKWISWLILVTHETLFTMRGATRVIVQTHQILRLPRKMNLMLDPCHTWNAIYNARRNKCHCPNSPNTTPATKNESHDWSLSHMKRYLQCAEQHVSLSKLTKYCACHEKWISWLILVTHETLFTMRGATSVLVQTHQILRLPRKMTLQNFAKISRKQLKRQSFPMRGRSENDPRMIRAGSDHETVIRNPPRNRGYFSRPPRPFCIENYNISRSGYHSKFHRMLRLPRKVALQLHQILPLPRKMNLMIDPCHTWNAIYNARNNRWHPPTSPNTAPATQNDCHDWSSSHMKRYETLFTMHGTTGGILQHHQILRLPRKMILQNFREISRKQLKRHFQCGADPSMIREWSELDPSWIRAGSELKTVIRNPPRNRGYFSGPPRAFCIEKYNISRSGYHSKFHRILRLPRKVTLQHHRILRLPRKMTVITDPRHMWNVISNARNNRCHPGTSANTAPATQNDSPTFQRNFSKTAETSFPMRGRSEHDPSWIREWSELDPSWKPSSRNRGYFSGPPRAFCIEKYNISRSGYHSKFHRILRLPRKVTLQHHRILRLPRKMTVITDPRRMWNVISNARNNRCHPGTSANTAPATQNDSPTFQRNFSKTAETSFPMRGRSEHDPSWIREWSELDPSWKPSSATRLATFSGPPRAFCIEKYNISRSGYHSKFHRILRLPRKVTLQLHRILRLPRKVTLERHQIVHLPRKVTLERHQIVHLPRKVTLELHQTVHLPRKVTLRYSTLL